MFRVRTIRRVLTWFVLLLLLAAGGAAGVGYWMWTQADEKLREVIIAKQRELAPDWDVEIPRAHFDWSRRVHIYDVTIKARGQTAPVVRLPEIVITIDREKFRDRQEVVIQKVRLVNPELHLTRDAAGRWNWQELLTLPKNDRPSPELEIEQGRVIVRLERPDGGPPALIGMNDCNLQLIPAARRQYAVTGTGQVDDAGRLAVSGQWDLDRRHWSLDGKIHDVATSGELLRLAAGASPELRGKLRQIDAALRRYIAGTETSEPLSASPPVSAPVAERATAAAPPADESVPDFGIRCTLDVDFHIAQPDPEREPDFRMAVRVRQGQLDHPVLPFPLRDIEGTIDWDNRQIVLRKLSARNGVTRVSMNGRFERLDSAATPGAVDVRVSRLPLDERLRRRLPALLGRQYDLLQPSGPVDLDVACVYDAQGRWTYRDLVLTAVGCAATNRRFPYPVTGVTGRVEQNEQGDFLVKLEGRAGRQRVRIGGRINRPGPEAEARFEIRVAGLPIDDQFREACPPAVQKTLAAIQAEGSLDALVKLYRPAGPSRPMQTALVLGLRDCAVEVSAFPYRINNLIGWIGYDTREKIWRFEDLQGQHADAVLTAFGNFDQNRTPHTLDMQITATNADLDNELERALPEGLRRLCEQLWGRYGPTGRVDQLDVRLGWTPDGSVRVALPLVKISGASLKLEAFPWLLTDVAVQFRFAGNRVDIYSLSGAHEGTRVWSDRPAYAIAEPDGGWQLRFEELRVDDLLPDRRFRETLPPELRSVVEELNPSGPPLSLRGMLHLRSGGPDVPVVTAAWDLHVYFAGGSLDVGAELEDLHGRMATAGTWDGQRIEMDGELELDSVHVLDYQFTQVRGPFKIRGDQLQFGSPLARAPDRSARSLAIASRDQISASAIGGLVTMNGEARLGAGTSYRLRISLRDGRLEQYARQYIPGARNLAGVMNGDVVLSGRGNDIRDLTGRGGLRISPAALYELPVIARVLASLNTLGAADKSAFDYADVEFEIARGEFRFQRIDLVGDALSLRGRGTVGFNGDVRLDFYSMMPRTRLPIGAIPGVNAILGEATKGWVGVRVRGKTSDPQTEPTYVPVLDETLRGFLRAFESAPTSMTPRLMPPFGTRQPTYGSRAPAWNPPPRSDAWRTGPDSESRATLAPSAGRR